jgi:hypothetical protein
LKKLPILQENVAAKENRTDNFVESPLLAGYEIDRFTLPQLKGSVSDQLS